MPRRTAVPRPDATTVAARVSGHLALAYRLGLAARTRPGYGRDDAVSSALCGLVEAANRFDPAPGGAFSTFAWRTIRWRISEDLRMAGRAAVPGGGDAAGLADVAAPDDDDDPRLARIPAALARLCDRDRAVLTIRFGLDGRGCRGPAEAGAELGTTRQHAYRLTNIALARLRGLMTA